MAESLEVSVELKGDKQLKAKIRRIDRNLEFWKAALDAAGDTLRSFYSTKPFATQGGIYGLRWRPLSPRYASRKAGEFPGRPVLVASGTMSRSFRKRTSRTSVRVFNPNRLFAFHQIGNSRLPQRVMMKLDRQRTRTVVDIMSEELRRKVSG